MTCAPIFHGVLVFWTDVYISNSLDGINWVVRHASDTGRPSVASLSFSSSKSTVINDAVARLVSSGVTAVVASGNTASDAYDSSPASEPSVIAVGASTIYDARANYSNWGGAIDIWAPGTQELVSESPKLSHLFAQDPTLSPPGTTAAPLSFPELPRLPLMSLAMSPISFPLTIH